MTLYSPAISLTAPSHNAHAANMPPAVVVGACAHGLTITHALAKAGINVILLEADPNQPGVRTRYAQVRLIEEINGEGLIGELNMLASELPAGVRPVLFLTNDHMVRTVAQHWPALEGSFRLSWGHCRNTVCKLLEKDQLTAHCQAQGINYPNTVLIENETDIQRAADKVPFPMFIKPARPLSGFKTAQPKDITELAELVEKFQSSLPFLAQQNIPGDDQSIYFSAIYFDHGNVVARFDGHKIRSRPLGHTTIAESVQRDDVFQQALRFFAHLDISGPVSLEVKQNADGAWYVIEPTVGRSDFWVGLCIANDINLPLIEYQHQVGLPTPARLQREDFNWYHEERDPFGWLWLKIFHHSSHPGVKSKFLYLFNNDPVVFLIAAWRVLLWLAKAVPRRTWKVLAGRGQKIAEGIPEDAPITREISTRKRGSMKKHLRRHALDSIASLGRLSVADVLLNGVAKFLRGAFGEYISLHKMYLMAHSPYHSPSPRNQTEFDIRPLLQGDPLCLELPQSIDNIKRRFQSGASCLVAMRRGHLVGSLWLTWTACTKSEKFRCHLHLASPGRSAIIFDEFVQANLNPTEILAALRHEATRQLAEQGVEWTFSLVSAFTPNSRTTNGSVHYGSATFLCIGSFQLAFLSQAPYLHVSFSRKAMPIVHLAEPGAQQGPRTRSDMQASRHVNPLHFSYNSDRDSHRIQSLNPVNQPPAPARSLSYMELKPGHLPPDVLASWDEDVSTGSLFSNPAWFEHLAQTGLPKGSRVEYFLVPTGTQDEASPRRSACIPLIHRREGHIHKIEALATFYTPLFSPNIHAETSEIASEKFAHYVAEKALSTDIVDFRPLDLEAPFFQSIQKALKDNGFWVDTYFCFGNWYLEVNGRSYAEYFDSLTSNIRKNMSRRLRKLSEHGCNISIFTDEGEELERALVAYEAIYRQSWKRPEPFPAFIPGLCRLAAKKGWLRLGLLTLGDTPVASQIWLVKDGEASIYKLAYVEEFAKLAPGTVLTCELMKRAIDTDKVKIIDYGIGDDLYKKEWMSHRRERFGIIAFNKWRPVGILAAARHYLGRFAKQYIPRSPAPARQAG